MTSGPQTREGQFIDVGWGFHGVLLGSQVFWALRWTMPETSLREVASQSGFTCRLSLPTWGSTWTG
jgi:hypothetical protein